MEKPIEAYRNADGEIQFKDTGDPLIDKWEEQIASGETPNLADAFDPESLEQLKRLKEKSAMSDPYSGLSMKQLYDKVESEGSSQGLGIGKNPILPKKLFGD
jgi:hypothetical protein